MDLNKLFAAFGFLSASCCLSLGHNARIAGMPATLHVLWLKALFRTAICSKQIAKSSEMNL